MTQETILITSATGRIGRELVARLAKHTGITVRACYFSESNADSLKALGADGVVNLTSPIPRHGRPH